MAVTHTEEQLQVLCREWQGVLRLQDWRVLVRVVRARQMSNGGCAGECDWTQNLKSGVICIVDPVDYPDDLTEEQDHELTLVHELLHLQFAPFWTDEGPDHPERIAMEQAIELTAQALVRLKREAKTAPRVATFDFTRDPKDAGKMPHYSEYIQGTT